MTSQPMVEILGVYRLPVTEELLQEQVTILYGSLDSQKDRAQAEEQCREQLSSTVLIEVIVHGRNSKFNVGDFTQPIKGQPKSDWQAAYAEAYLTPNGEALIVERWSDPPGTGDLRIALFMHFWEPNTPLRTSYGDTKCPAPTAMPERLKLLVPYEPID